MEISLGFLLGAKMWIYKEQKWNIIFVRFKWIDASRSFRFEIPYFSCDHTENSGLMDRLPGFQTVNHDMWHYNMVTKTRQIKLHLQVFSVLVLRQFWHADVFWSVINESRWYSVTCCPLYNWDIAIFMILLILFWINRLTCHRHSRQRSNILRREILQMYHSFFHSNHQFWAICCF